MTKKESNDLAKYYIRRIIRQIEYKLDRIQNKEIFKNIKQSRRTEMIKTLNEQIIGLTKKVEELDNKYKKKNK